MNSQQPVPLKNGSDVTNRPENQISKTTETHVGDGIVATATSRLTNSAEKSAEEQNQKECQKVQENSEQEEFGPHVVQIQLQNSSASPNITGATDHVICPVHSKPSVNYYVTPDGSRAGVKHDNDSASHTVDKNVPDLFSGGAVNQTLFGNRNGFAVRRYLPKASVAGSLDAYRRGERIIHSISATDFSREYTKYWLAGRRMSDVTHARSQSKERQLYKYRGSNSDYSYPRVMENEGREPDGILNPAFEPDKNVENKSETNDTGTEEARSGAVTPSGDSATVTVENEDKQTLNNSIRSSSSGSKVPPTAQIAPTIQRTDNNDVTDKDGDINNITISVTNEHGQGQIVENIPKTSATGSGDRTNGKVGVPPKQSGGYASKLSETMNKREITSDSLEVNFLRDELQLSNRRVQGRRLLYMNMGPYGDEDAKWLDWIEVKFREIAGDDGEISLDEFKDALKMKKNFYAERFFQLFDQDGSGSIELGELMDGLRMLTKGTPAQRLQFLFDVYDVDGSGCIDRDELKCVLMACMEESSMSLSDDNLDDLTDALFDAADADESGEITFEELQGELEKHPGVIQNLTISAAQWLRPPENVKKENKFARYFTKKYIENNLKKVIFFLVYWALNIVLFAVAMWQYRASNGWIMVARGCGLCLNFNCMFVLVLMLRKCITFLRMTQLCHVLPFDQHIQFHKMTAWAIAVFSLIHTLAHIGNAVVVSNSTPLELWEVLFTTKAGIGWVKSSAFITGWILDVILIVMVICSQPFIRRSGHFQVFYWTHILYIPFWILVILHGPHFWKWFIVPGVIFILEKISRSKLIKMARYGETFVDEVNLMPSGVTHLIITRPLNFKYQPGDYVFIQIPAIAKQEWHPFTISSAPEMDGHIWLHVRSAGHWTNKLYSYFDKLAVDEEKQLSQLSRASSGKRKLERVGTAFTRKRTAKSSRKNTQKRRIKNKFVKVKCYIDGPYGTGTREVFNTNHAVLVGAGIGVTPMASILQSVWYRFNAHKRTCPNCAHTWVDDEETEEMKLKKVDFIWINRDQKSFEWFLTLLNQLEYDQSATHGPLEQCIQMHMYMTAAQKKNDMKGIGLQIALDLMYEKSHKDLITGLKTKTQPGRPDWNQILTNIKEENKGKVKVFFCGPPALGKNIKEVCARFKYDFSKENF